VAFTEPSPEQFPESPLRNLSEHLEFLDLTAADQTRLHQIAEILKSHGQEFVDTFYRHLHRFPQSSQHLQDAELVARLKQAQLKHLDSMLQADWSEAYQTQRLRVGDVHAQVGIDPPMFLGAYNHYMHFVIKYIAEHAGVANHECIGQIKSLVSAVLLDIGLTLEAYFAHGTRSLRNALDMLWQANTNLRQFAQLTSHDLKTPLATVANLCDEVIDEFREQLPDEAVELIQKARDRTFRMSTTIDELLATSIQLNDGNELEAFPLEKALSEALERVRPVIDEKQIQVRMPTTLPAIQGDRVKVREALYNILSNATKFIQRQPGQITIALETSEQTCVLSIADNGPGIPPEELHRVFVPFRRLPMHRHLPGSGLGLYFTKSLIEQQGGRIWVESKLGQGSTFFIEFRL
jgi:signal transduction histidine kinase